MISAVVSKNHNDGGDLRLDTVIEVENVKEKHDMNLSGAIIESILIEQEKQVFQSTEVNIEPTKEDKPNDIQPEINEREVEVLNYPSTVENIVGNGYYQTKNPFNALNYLSETDIDENTSYEF